jgi:hypothetical protein
VEVLTGAGMLPMTGEAGRRNRELIRGRLLALQPKGYTNTLAALERAYEYERVDSIVLFTDGAPLLSTTPRGSLLDTRMRDAIYRLVDRNRSVPLNVIGLGNFYGQRPFTEFLLELARRTDGAFIGR